MNTHIDPKQTIQIPRPQAPEGNVSIGAPLDADAAAFESVTGNAVINVTSKTPGTELISNFSASPFEIDGVHFASVEAFVQFIKYPDSYQEKNAIRELVGAEAKRAGNIANEENKEKLLRAETPLVFWQKQTFPFRSDAHYGLIERALEAKFRANSDAAGQLATTAGKILTHDLGSPDTSWTSLPREVFCSMLERIRSRLAS